MRRVYFDGEFMEVEIHDRSRLKQEVEGPAIIEEYGSTTVVPPCWRAGVDSNGCLILRR